MRVIADETGVIQDMPSEISAIYVRTGMDWSAVCALNPVQLAYIGDTVYDLYVRTRLLQKGVARQLHRSAVGQVCAQAQARAYARIEDSLSLEEAEILRRGKNVHTRVAPKNADPVDYAKATAIEALVGYLYLSGRDERLNEIMRTALGEGDSSCPG